MTNERVKLVGRTVRLAIAKEYSLRRFNVKFSSITKLNQKDRTGVPCLISGVGVSKWWRGCGGGSLRDAKNQQLSCWFLPYSCTSTTVLVSLGG